MSEIRPIKPVKLFVGLLAQQTSTFDLAVELCAKEFGEAEKRGEVLPFSHTDYYTVEMGKDLLRQFVTFRALIDPEWLPGIKRRTNQLEKEVASRVGGPVLRPVNIDPGYVSMSAVVLATTKNYSHRLYLGKGIYGEVTLHFHEGSFSAWPWTYPDYQTAPYLKFFNEARARYIQQLRREEMDSGSDSKRLPEHGP